MTILEAPPEALALAELLLAGDAFPRKAAEDALHLAIAAVNGIDYLVTWNCRHLANAAIRRRIDGVCRGAGYKAPVICTPEELMEE